MIVARLIALVFGVALTAAAMSQPGPSYLATSLGAAGLALYVLLTDR